MSKARKCKVCGQPALGPLTSRAELLALIVRVDAELKREAPHPAPKVQTYEQLADYERNFIAGQRGRVEAMLERVIEPDVAGICWDCGHAKRMAGYAELKKARELELEELRRDALAKLDAPPDRPV